MKTNTPQQFALQLGALVALYASLASLITLLFSCITLALPDAAASSWESTQAESSIRFSLATLVIMFPVFITLTRVVNTTRRKNNGNYLNLTRWVIYLSLLVGGSVVLGDAISVLYNFLNGELTARFLLKAAVLAVILKASFVYYLLDVRGYWHKHEKQSVWCGVVATLLVVSSLAWGFVSMPSPTEVRDERIDQAQLDDLRNIQWKIEDYLAVEEKLPESLDEIYTVTNAPEASSDRAAYRYELTESGFKLCAEFSASSTEDSHDAFRPTVAIDKNNEKPYIKNPYDWEHREGEWCFERMVHNDRIES